jgi:hypothetical protein
MSARNCKMVFLGHCILLFGNINWHSYSGNLTSQLTVVGHVEEPCLLDIPFLPPFEEIRHLGWVVTGFSTMTKMRFILRYF